MKAGGKIGKKKFSLVKISSYTILNAGTDHVKNSLVYILLDNKYAMHNKMQYTYDSMDRQG